jgi:hypothetical protein
VTTLIYKQVEQNKGKIYACFVDFNKPLTLFGMKVFLKLLENKIDGQFYSLIKSLYSNSNCGIKQNNIRTDFFTLMK